MSYPTEKQRLIIFDVDGTLIDDKIGNNCFDHAFREITGVSLTQSIWSQFKEVTGSAIIHQALGDTWPDIPSTVDRVVSLFLTKLQASSGDNNM